MIGLLWLQIWSVLNVLLLRPFEDERPCFSNCGGVADYGEEERLRILINVSELEKERAIVQVANFMTRPASR
jgi:hypothetical protein